MTPYQERVTDQRIALFDETQKLLNFTNSAVYNNLPDKERALIRKQLKIMVDYLDVLNDRIEGYEVGS